MNTPLACLVAVTFFPIVLSWVSGYYRQKTLGSVDNNNPRTQCSKLEGAGARAVAAQSNAWEALAMFSAALLAAQIAGVVAGAAVANVCLLFVVMRVLHGLFYIADKAPLRSIAFIVGVGCCIRIFYLALVA